MVNPLCVQQRLVCSVGVKPTETGFGRLFATATPTSTMIAMKPRGKIVALSKNEAFSKRQRLVSSAGVVSTAQCRSKPVRAEEQTSWPAADMFSASILDAAGRSSILT
jgi:hypothetical protein